MKDGNRQKNALDKYPVGVYYPLEKRDPDGQP